ncbi:MAG: FAD-dependent oxidoreductase [Anaerolineae bacterium]
MQRFYSGAEANALFSSPTPLTADVVIIGGGQAGPATAWAIEREDPTARVIVLEANGQLAGGASTASLEQFRTCWTPKAIAEQVRWSAQLFLDPDSYLGGGAAQGLNVRRRGYLWLAMDEQEARAQQENVALLHSWGLRHAIALDTGDLRRAYPWLPERVVGAKLDPMAGWLNSDFLANRFARATANTRFLLETPAQAILAEHGRVTGVQTTRGVLTTTRVILAAGPGSRLLGKTVGLDLPIVCIPRQSFSTPFRHPGIPADAPVVISRYPYAHFRPDGDGLLFAWSYHWARHPADERSPGYLDTIPPVQSLKDGRFPEATLWLLGRQFGHREGEGFRDSRYLSRRIAHQIGYYVYRQPTLDPAGRVTHSERAIIDRCPDPDGLVLSIAHAGHGIMTAPAAAHIAASLALGKTPRIPLWEDFGLGVEQAAHEEGAGL